MAKIIDDETMENVCILSKLSLSEEEKEKAKAEMQKMLDYVEKLDELFRCGREANGQQNIQFIDDRQHDILIIRCKQRITERKALDMIAGKAEQLAGFKRLNLKFRRLLGKIANGGKERKHIISRKTGDTFITVLVYI